MSIEGLRFGPIDKRAAHACIDMQRLFAEGTEWASSGVHAISPLVSAICQRSPERTIFTRFMTPVQAEHAPGQWRIYYRRWASVLGANQPDEIFDIVPALSGFIPPARVVDKYTHSAFEAPEFQQALDSLDADTLIFTGVETDVCVLATVLTAVDRGFRVILVSDAITSSDLKSHSAAMASIYPRYDMQVETVTAQQLLEAWNP